MKLLDVLCLWVQHAEHHLVPLPHALCMRWADIILDDGFPLPPANPASQKALDLQQTMQTVNINVHSTWNEGSSSDRLFYFFDLLNFWIVISRSGCGAGMDLLVVFEQPSNLSQKQAQERPVIATYTLLFFSLTVTACKQSDWIDRTGPVSTVNTETLAWLN